MERINFFLFKRKGCFNCDGDHHFNECPEPKDMKRIRMRQNDSRYHDDAGSSEKKFRAGRISDELRNALGIGKHDIPEYIYRMRRMGFIDGYPPGHLKKFAFFVLFYALKSSVIREMADLHQLKVFYIQKDEQNSPPPKINADKMIYYCGFNQSYRELRDVSGFLLYNLYDSQSQKNHSEGRFSVAQDVAILQNQTFFLGSSIGVMMGTPVLTRRRVNDDGAEAEQDESTTPSLESFRKGVVPFEAREEPTPHKGFLRRIMNKIRKARPN
uniref:PSP domain-containing protein n=1 Tax=Angiostrongylus cantonensis TaxID=6313 RepID=A0A0K0DIT8_ANGCA